MLFFQWRWYLMPEGREKEGEEWSKFLYQFCFSWLFLPPSLSNWSSIQHHDRTSLNHDFLTQSKHKQQVCLSRAVVSEMKVENALRREAYKNSKQQQASICITWEKACD
jgi:hypothetical protein